MKESLLADRKPLTEEEAFAEIDRLSAEIAGMLERAKRNIEDGNRIGQENRAKLAEVQKILSCWND